MSTTPPASQRSRTALISAAGLILAVAAEACSVGLLGLSGWFIASSTVAGASAYSLFSYLDPSAGVRAFALGRIAANYASRLALHAAALRRVAAARLGFYDRAAAEPGTHGTWSGQSLDRVMADADTSGMALIQATAPMITSAVLTAGGGLVIVLAGYPLVAVAVAVAVAACALLASAGPRHAGDVIQVRSALRTDLVTAAGAWAEMASLGAASQLADRTLRRLAAFEDRQYRQAAVTARAAGAARAVTAATLLLSVMLAATRGASVSMLVFLALLAAGVLANAERFIAAAHARVLATQASQRLTSAGRGQAPRPSRPPALHVAYDRRGVTVSGYQLPEIPVRDARQIGFTAAPSQTLVITGASGSGKTTLLNAIAAALRQPGAHPGPGPVTTVLADDYLFTGTIASNIRLASPAASDDDVKDLLTAMLLDRAGLSPSTRTGTGGRDLSGGEQRRLHIARALATRPGMLLIDEPTTGLDARTDTHVLMAIRRRLPQAVLIMAIHGPPEDPDALGTAWTAVPLD